MSAAIPEAVPLIVGPCAVFVVTLGELTLALPILDAASRRFGYGAVIRGLPLPVLAIGALSAIIVLLFDQLAPADLLRPAGCMVFGLLALFFAYRFGVADVSSYRGFKFDGLIPDPRGGFRRDAAGVAAWAVGVEGLKIAAAWIGGTLANGIVPACVALLAAVLLVVMLQGTVSHYYWRLSPTIIYAIMLNADLLDFLAEIGS